MIKMYSDLINKALNGALSENEAQTLKALDDLIDTEEKHDEGLYDLEHYSWAFGPNNQSMLDGAEGDVKVMGQSLAEFRPIAGTNYMNRQAVDPIQLIGGLDSKSEVLNAMATDNPIEKASMYFSATGYVPDDVLMEYKNAIKPIEDLSQALSEVQDILENVPEENPGGWSDKDWATLRYGPSYPIPEGEGASEYAKVAGRWILSLGLPLAGTALGIYTGQPLLGTAAGAAIAPSMPINETLELMDEETRTVFATTLANNGYIATLAGISVASEKKSLNALSKIGNKDLAAEIVENANSGVKGPLLSRLKGNSILKFMGKTAGKLLQHYKKIIVSGYLGYAAFQNYFGDGGNDTADVSPPSDNVVEDEYVEEETEGSSPGGREDKKPDSDSGITAEDLIVDTNEDDLFAGLYSKDEFSKVKGWGDEERGLGETTKVPQAQHLRDGAFQGFDYSGGIYEGQEDYVGPGEWKYTPQYLPPGAEINNKAMAKIQVGGVQMTMMAFVGLVASNYNIPPEILYGMIEHETQKTWDPEKRANDPNENSWGLAQINMASFGEGTENPSGHIPEGHEFISKELATDPRYAINFLAHNVRRIADDHGGNIMAGVIGHRGGGKAASHYANNNEFMTQNDADYVDAVIGNARNLGFLDSKIGFDVSGVSTKREWDPYNATPQEGVNLFIDDMVETMLGVKAGQEDYDYWTPRYHEAHKNVYEGTQTALDKGARYEGESVSNKMSKNMEDTGEYKFADEKRNYQTVQDWFTKNVMGAFN